MKAGLINTDALTVTGKSIGENNKRAETIGTNVIKPVDNPVKENAGLLVLSGNIFSSAIMKASAIDAEFRERYLCNPDDKNVFEARAIVFEGPEDYHKRIDDPDLNIDVNCILVIRGVGPVGYPGSAEVVNMMPPKALLEQGVKDLPTLGDGRQSGTSGAPSILNVSPEAAVGGNLALLKTGDIIRVDLNTCRVDVLVDDKELQRRRKGLVFDIPENQTWWQEIYRKNVSGLDSGAVFEDMLTYKNIAAKPPRHSH